MKILDVQQGSPEWFECRCGIPTSSSFDKIVTTKGVASTQRTKYLYKLAGERITRLPEGTFQSQAMLRGIEMEAEARSFYEFTTGQEVQQVGFCLSDDGLYGASPDGLVGDKGALEIKCPTIPVHVDYLIKGVLPTDYFQQVQGQLLVTKREWVDFLSYYPGLKPLIVRVFPDTGFIDALKYELFKACGELNEITERIK